MGSKAWMIAADVSGTWLLRRHADGKLSWTSDSDAAHRFSSHVEALHFADARFVGVRVLEA